MNINEFLEATVKAHNAGLSGWGFVLYSPNNRPRIVCTDGFSMSVQASEGHYCEPRENFLKHYDSVEVGYPSEEEPLLIDYAEDPDEPTHTVYGYVPVELVDEVIKKHGGVHQKIMEKRISDFMAESSPIDFTL